MSTVFESCVAELALRQIRPSPEQCLDVLWLTAWMNDRAVRQHVSPEPSRASQKGMGGETGAISASERGAAENGEKVTTADSREQGDAPDPNEEKVSLFAASNLLPPGRTSDHGGEVGLRSPRGAALPGALVLGRKIRPLRRRSPSKHRQELDEAATADFVSRTRLWLPVMRAAPERQFDLALVVDDSDSMVVWRETIRELRLLFERLGAFRRIQYWRFAPVAEDVAFLWRGPAKEPVPAPTLIEGGSRQIVLVVSDCIHPEWCREMRWRALAEWGAWHPVSLLQLLPQHLWCKTALSETEVVRVTNRKGCAIPNADLTELTTGHEYRPPGALRPVPITTLRPDHLGRWAMLTSGYGDAQLPAAIFTPEPKSTFPAPEGNIDEERLVSSLTEELEEEDSSGQSDPMSIVTEFIGAADSLSRRLLSLLAAAPLTLPVMRLVRQSLLPESGQEHLAEVFNSGLLRMLPHTPEASDEHICYDFLPGVREELLRHSMVAEAVKVQEQISRYIEPLFDTGEGFAAHAHGKLYQGPHRELLDHFATVRRRVFSQIGLLPDEFDSRHQLKFVPKRDIPDPTAAAVEEKMNVSEEPPDIPDESAALVSGFSVLAAAEDSANPSAGVFVDEGMPLQTTLRYCPSCRGDLKGVSLGWTCTRDLRQALSGDLRSSWKGEAFFGSRDVVGTCFTYNVPGATVCRSQFCAAGRAAGRRESKHFKKACPVCTRELPDLEHTKQKTIAVLGPSGSGKSSYILALSEWWKRELYHYDLNSFHAMDQRAKDTLKAYHEAVIVKKQRIPKTLNRDATFSWQFFQLNSPDKPLVMLSIPDAAGSDLVSASYISRSKYLRFVSGIVFLIDGALLCAEGEGEGPEADFHEHAASLQAMFSCLADEFDGGQWRQMPIGICVNKLDFLAKLDPDWDEPTVNFQPLHEGHFDHQGCRIRSEAIEQLLWRNDRSRSLIELVRSTRANVMYFAMATLGAHSRVVRFRPYSIEDPFLWMMWRMYFID